jgi:Tfp pilus assembly protein PilN
VIEVNLLPGGAKRARKAGGGRAFGGLKLRLPSMGGGGSDKWVLGAAAVVLVALGAMGWMFTSLRKQRADAEVALEAAQRDSARFSDLIARTQLLTARRDSIGVRVGIIQKIDQNRFVWAHIMDEVARALPDYTWLTELAQVSNDPITIRLTGQAGNNFALTVFMEQLEASPFLQGVTLIQSAQEMAGAGGAQQQVVQGFQLEVGYVQPPM